MKLSRNQQRALRKLEHFITKLHPNRTRCNDEGFHRSISHNRQYEGPTLSPEGAYFQKTDRGYDVSQDQTTHWEHYKQLVIGHRLLAITIGMWQDEWNHMLPRERVAFIHELTEDGFCDPIKFFPSSQ